MRSRLRFAGWLSAYVWIAFAAVRGHAQDPASSATGGLDVTQFPKMPATRITGVVRDPAGAPAADVVVSFISGHYPGANPYSVTKSDRDGRYELVLPQTEMGGFRGHIYATNIILARSLERNLAAMDSFFKIPDRLNLTLRPGITLSGSFRDTDGAAVTNATFEPLFVWGPGSIPLDGFYNAKSHPQKVDVQGRFSIPALLQGLEYLFLPNNILAEGYGSISAHVDADSTHTNHYEFPPFVLKRANLVLAGQVLGPDGKPAVGALVGFSGEGQRIAQSTKSDPAGNFEFKDVAAGPVRVTTGQTTSIGGQGVTVPITVQTKGGDTNIILRLRTQQP
jgi:hypothetical protein